MRNITDLKIGQKLEISQATLNDYNDNRIITSQLIDKNEEFLFISLPIFSGTPYYLYVGSKIKIIFSHKDKGNFSVIAEVISKKTNKITIYGVKPISEPIVVQRRQYFRIDMLKNVTVKELESDKEVKCYTKNISGGGIKLICNKKIQAGKVIECKLFLKEGYMVTAVGKIITTKKSIDETKYELSVEFENISDSTRNNIVSYIFEFQRLLRKRGLI
ncbi:MAG: flagellar brake protein [Clostridiales bacterium]|nr:flagellar brake protein [Clostridiales bacterium]